MLFSEAPGFLLPLLGDLADAARRMDAPVEHLLLDEFQDTSDPQWAVLRHFAHRASQEPGSVFVVGDVKQAIYGWRGGRAEIFERIETELPDIGREARDVSYRSSQVILDTVNQVFACTGRLRRPQRACRGAQPLAGALSRAPGAEDPRPAMSRLRETPADADPLDYAAARIAENVGRPAADHDGRRAGAQERDGGAAGRWPAGGGHRSQQRGDRGRRRRPGGGNHPDLPSPSPTTPATPPPPSTSPARPSPPRSACHPMDTPAPPRPPPSPTPSAANSWSEATRASSPAGPSCLSPYGTERTARRLEQLVDLAATFDALPPMRPSEFVQAVRDAAIDNPGAARVRVMTINRAKGLEFDAVFLPELDWKAQVRPAACLTQRAALTDADASPIAAVYAYPNETLRRLHPALEAAHAARHDEEITGMLCLLYVALTRARHALHLFVRPPAAGPTPANLLRHALAALSESLPDGGTRLYANGNEDWHGHAPPAEPAAAPPPPRAQSSASSLPHRRRHAQPDDSEVPNGGGFATAGLRNGPHPAGEPTHLAVLAGRGVRSRRLRPKRLAGTGRWRLCRRGEGCLRSATPAPRTHPPSPPPPTPYRRRAGTSTAGPRRSGRSGPGCGTAGARSRRR